MSSVVQTVYHSSQMVHKNPHFHDCHQIILVVNGTVDFCVNDKRFKARAGDIAIFSRYENHTVLESSDKYERFVLHIDSDVVNRKSPVYSLLTDRPVGFCNIIDVSPYRNLIIDIFKRILLEHNSEARLADEMEQLAVKQLLIAIYRCTSVDFDSAYDDVVISIKREFENQYNKKYTLNALARKYSISVSSLSHRFQSATGVSVMEYLQSCRIAHAKQMLVETDTSIGEIVEKCGFSDNSNFSRTFKILNGLSPTDFRKKNKAE